MECFTVRDLTFSYPEQTEKALDGLMFTVGQGEFVTLAGPSGCGKTTLLKHLKPVLAPHGTRSGEILFENRPLAEIGQREQSARIGFVMQNPDNQIVTDKVWHELAFGLESLGYDTPSIRRRVAEMSSFFGIEAWFYKNVSELSGGQKQLLNLASIMVMQPSVLILDEPTGSLDPIAASDFLGAVGKINRELGTTIIITEQRLEEVFPMSDRVLVMDKGKLICEGTPAEVGEALKSCGHSMFLSMPAPMRIYAAVPNNLKCPVTVRDGRLWLNEFSAGHEIGKTDNKDEMPEPAGEKPVVELDGVWFKYEKDLPDVIKGLSLKAFKGEFLAILGGNGAGKTTALSLIAGIIKPHRGKISFCAPENSGCKRLVGMLPQNPQTVFAKKTVLEDLLEVFENEGIDKGEKERKVSEVSRLCRLESLLCRHPYDLSGGEQQRAALAKTLLGEPEILLLDEPTKGLDAEFKSVLAEILGSLTGRGVTIIMVSHDVEFCAKYARRCALFFDGGIITEGPPRAFFSGNGFYTTAANRMARHLMPDAVTAEDVIFACGGRMPDPPTKDSGLRREPLEELGGKTSEKQLPPAKRKLSKRTVVSAAMILLVVPLTRHMGISCFGERKYYIIALMIIMETMLPFFLAFEGRKPQGRELVVISVMCALGVAGRAAFFMLPQFKPVVAVVIISGVAFGCETGFLVGAVTMFVSNMMFGQGPWTPWQMFAMGIIGFLAGAVFRRGARGRLPLSIFGGLSTIVIYGGLMNPSFVVMYQRYPSWPMLLAAYIQGLPFDLVHAAATVVFLWLISGPMLEKLDRIKVKYGLIDFDNE